MFTNSNWFAFQDDRIGDAPMSTSPTEVMDEINLNGTSTNGNSSSDDEVVVGEDEELTESKTPTNNSTSSLDTKNLNGFAGNNSTNGDSSVPQNENPSASSDMSFLRFESPEEDLFGDRPLPEWVGWGDPSDFQVGGSSVNPFEDPEISSINLADPADEGAAANVSSPSSGEILPNGTSTATDSSDGSSVGPDPSQRVAPVPSLFEEDVEFVGVELEGTEKAMEQALKEGIVGEAGPLKRNLIPKVQGKENEDESGSGMKEFNDANYWRVDQEVAVTE